MLEERGTEDVRIRAAVVALPPRHPYLRLPVQFATSLKNRIRDGGLMGKSELDEAIAECERVASNPQTTGTTFVVMQLRGRKPGVTRDRNPRQSPFSHWPDRHQISTPDSIFGSGHSQSSSSRAFQQR
jgi:hypothetical protein